MSDKCYEDELDIEEVKKALYEIYLVLYKHRHIYKRPSHLVATYTEAFANQPWTWKVVGITRQALDLLAANDFEIPTHQICRGHFIDRRATIKEMFARDQPMQFDEFWETAIERDKTVLMTYKENGKGKPFPEYIPFDSGDLFPDGVGVTYRKAEKEFLKKKHSELTPYGLTPKASAGS